ncbi:TetR/AcrR family transcriptional regulator [Rhodospirillum centenum]|uniref:Transcriptional regulator, TetR family protein n=1 Tax=Rhodospirillum centenum (strain ATCC 51521 / SW) TaxID=414684 RepID=B6IP26_RHOCS|nr:TetR/AcrR family transcriptional regulator [Rhodospirillum centenum]ACI99446.1 transcriptional regulator, TetR family protein [Rhodospirillum centenum SW]
MPDPLPRRRKETRPAELLEAALDLFAEKGFAATRMEDIAARAGASKGTLYLYFPSKQAVFEALVHSALLPNIERLETVVAGYEGRMSELLRTTLRILGRLLENRRLIVLPKLVLAEAANFPDLARFHKRAVVDRGLGLIASILERGMARGEFRRQDPLLVARLYVAPFLMMVMWRTTFEPLDDAFAIDTTRHLETHLDILLRGLAAEETP